MHLILQSGASERDRELSAELFKTEQYVEMVLSYLRLGSDYTDYIIVSCPLDKIVRQAVRKYAPLFIRTKTSLKLEEISCEVVTDEKWLTFVIEQILSNTVKYSAGKTVIIRTENDRRWSLKTVASVLQRKTFRAYLKKALQAITGASEGNQPASVFIYANVF